MKFLDWDDYTSVINEYGRQGYVKKSTSYNILNGINSMIMIHKYTEDTVELVLYEDEELYDLDITNEAYVKPRLKHSDIPRLKPFEENIDHRRKEHRSSEYPDKPGVSKNTNKPHPYKKRGK